MGDINGDGRDDIIGIAHSVDYVAYSMGYRGYMPKEEITEMGINFTTTYNWNYHPRFIIYRFYHKFI